MLFDLLKHQYPHPPAILENYNHHINANRYVESKRCVETNVILEGHISIGHFPHLGKTWEGGVAYSHVPTPMRA